MELTLDAVDNPFGLSLDDEETTSLTRLASDPHVRRVLVLPSFKLKKETLRWLGREIGNTRCDDTVVLADGLHPRYANYEIGCGFVTVLLDLDATAETRRGVAEAVRRFVRAHNGWSDRVRRATGARLSTRRRASVSYRDPFSIRPAEWASMVSGGVAAFLDSRSDPYRWLGSLEAFGAGGNHFAGRVEPLRDLLDPAWLDGRRHYSHDASPLRFTGSHYLDLLQVREIAPEATTLSDAPLTAGKLVLMLHAHGTNFGQVLREDALRRVLDDPEVVPPPEADRLMQVVGLMNNQAALHRVSLALKFLDALAAVFGPIGAWPLAEQPHYTVVRDGETFAYLCDAQHLRPGLPCLLPAGYPLADSYLLTAGPNAGALADAVSHNLKRILQRHAQASRHQADEITTMEVRTAGHGRLGTWLRRGPPPRGGDAPHDQQSVRRRTRRVDGGTGAVVPLASLRPVLRLHTVRPGEKPCTAWTAQGGAR